MRMLFTKNELWNTLNYMVNNIRDLGSAQTFN